MGRRHRAAHRTDCERMRNDPGISKKPLKRRGFPTKNNDFARSFMRTATLVFSTGRTAMIRRCLANFRQFLFIAAFAASLATLLAVTISPTSTEAPARTVSASLSAGQ